MQRYYFDEFGGEIPQCPECLKGPEYDTCQSGIFDIESYSDSVDLIDGISRLSKPSAGSVVEDIPAESITPVKSDFTSFQEFVTHHGLNPELTVDEYTLIPKENRDDIFCRCKGCGDPDRSTPVFWIPGRPYNQVCQKHYDEMKNLSDKEKMHD